MKESRQNYREIKLEDDKITENASVRSALIFRNLQ